MALVSTGKGERPERRNNALINADRPERRLAGGGPWDSGERGRALGGEETTEQVWDRQYPEAARRYGWLQNQVLVPQRRVTANRRRTEVDDLGEMTRLIKEYALSLG